MPKRILFTSAYFYRFDEKQWRNQQPYPPYATILAAAYLRSAGFEVQLFDSNLKESPQEIGGSPVYVPGRPNLVTTLACTARDGQKSGLAIRKLSQ